MTIIIDQDGAIDALRETSARDFALVAIVMLMRDEQRDSTKRLLAIRDWAREAELELNGRLKENREKIKHLRRIRNISSTLAGYAEQLAALEEKDAPTRAPRDPAPASSMEETMEVPVIDATLTVTRTGFLGC